MRQRKKKPLKEGMVYCKHCKGNGLIKPYRIEPFMVVTNKCKYCNGTGQRDWIDVMFGKIPEVKMRGFDVNKLRLMGIPINKKSRNNRIYPDKIFEILKNGIPLGSFHHIYGGNMNPINYNPWMVRVKK